MSTRAERTIIDILEEAEPRVLGAAELRELRAALYSRFDLGAELAGGEDVVSARPFPDSLIYNPHLRVHQREADTVLYLFRLDRAVALDDGWAALLDSFRRPVRTATLLGVASARVRERLEQLVACELLIDADGDWERIEWRGSRVVQHTEDIGSRATYPPIAALPQSELYQLLGRRARPDYRYDQSLVSPFSVAARVAAIEREMPHKGHVLVVGDDDFLSLALAREGFRVTVGELDKRIVSTLGQLAKELELPLEAHVVDVRGELPVGWGERFDAAVTDPIYDAALAQRFVRFSLSAIRQGGMFFLSFASWMEAYRELFPWLLDYGLRMRRLYPRMNEYYSGTERGQCGPFASLLQGEVDPEHVVPPPLFYSDFHAFEYDGVSEQDIAGEAG